MATDNDALRELRRVSTSSAAHLVKHYLYFPSKSAGKNVARQLRERGFEVDDRLDTDGDSDEESWLVLARRSTILTEHAMAELRELFEAIAEEYNGEYDGWEAKVENNGA